MTTVHLVNIGVILGGLSLSVLSVAQQQQFVTILRFYCSHLKLKYNPTNEEKNNVVHAHSHLH